MKKLTAMLLVLCMLLAAVPALGEDVSGIWYINLADVTLGYFQLNEDGTVNALVPGSDPYTGTWTIEGDQVTVTIDGAPVTFTYDGTSLSSAQFPLPVIRQEGKLSMDLVSKMMSGEEYELPEGLTKEEVASIALNFMAEYQRIMNEMNGTGSPAAEEPAAEEPAAEEPAAEAAEPTVTILQENFRVIESYKGFRAVYIAKLQNNTDTPFHMDRGYFTVSDKDGKLLGESKSFYTHGSRYLEPGEITFIKWQVDLDENIEVDYTREFEVSTDSWYNKDAAVTLTDPIYFPAGDISNAGMKATVVNDTDKPIPGIYVIFALEDAEGNLMDLQTESLYRHELGVNSTLTMITSVDGRTAEYMTANEIVPTVVEAYAWYEVND